MLICKVTSYKHLLQHNHSFIKYTMQEVKEIQFQTKLLNIIHMQQLLAQILTLLPHLERSDTTKEK